MLRRLTSAGSRPSVPAIRSIVRSMASAASGRPAPRYGAFGTLLVAATRAVAAKFAILYGPSKCTAVLYGDADADRVPGAAIHQEVITKCQDVSRVIEPDLDVMQLVARVGGADEMFLPLLDPANRAADQARHDRDHQVLGIDMSLHAEAAADVERKAAHPRLRQLQDRRCLATNRMHHLCRRPDCDGIGSPVVGADHAAALDRHAGITMRIEAATQSMRRVLQRRSGVALRNHEFADEIGLELLVHERAARFQCRL